MGRAARGEDAGRTVTVRAGDVDLEGDLAVPPGATGVVAFAHGSGSSRHSPRNRFVAAELQKGGLATLLFDLLTAEEDEIDRRTRELRFNIALLADRLVGAADWLGEQDEGGGPSTGPGQGLPLGLFGASTGSAAALIAAARRPEAVRAVVSRGGRPDLAADSLPDVKAPTLLIVGGNDPTVLGMNRDAAGHLRCEHEIEVVEGASHLFEEPGTLEEVARLARDWFRRHLG